MTTRSRSLRHHYTRWSGLDPHEPRWGWIWMLALHGAVLSGAVLWTVAVVWVFERWVG